MASPSPDDSSRLAPGGGLRALLVKTLLWGLGLGGGYWLAYQGLPGLPPLNSPQAFWGAGALALALTALAFIALLRMAVRSRG